MIAIIALALAMAKQDEDSICLARTFKVGDVDVYQVRISETGKTTPLGNSFTIQVKVEKGPVLVAIGQSSPYKPRQVLAKWSPLNSGSARRVLSCQPGFEFLPYSLVGNDASLKSGEMEALSGGSIRLLSDKDSVAQLKVWLPIGKGLFIDEDSDIEVASRLVSHAKGIVYRQSGNQLVPERAFVLDRVRTKLVVPIPQEGD